MTNSAGREEVESHQRPKQNQLCCKLRKGNKVTGKIGGLPVSLKVDTGSATTFITTKTFKSIPYKLRPGLKPTRKRFIAANGTFLDCEGETVLTMDFGEELYFPVIVGGVTENLLGQDFIQHFRCVLDFVNKEMYITKGGKEEIQCRQKIKRLARVVAAESIVIPAKSECLLPGKFKDKPLKGDGVLIQDKTFLKRHELLLARSLVNSEQLVFQIRLLNPGSDEVKVHTGTVIALFEHVTEGNIEQVCNVQTRHETFPTHLEDLVKQNTDKLTTEEAELFKDLLARKQEAFVGPGEVGRCNLGKHHINLTDDTPIKDSPRRVPMYKRDEVQEQVKKLEEQGLIEKSDSPYSAQTVLVKKKSGKWRMCVDYRKLNEKTIKDAYPLPRIEDNLDSLAGARMFSTLDCNMAYHQIELEEKDKIKTAFATPLGGLYHYVTMPFGLCNAPATFQRVAEKALEGLQWKIAVLYLDDIIVFSHDFESHIKNLELVLDRMITAGLKLKPSKCTFFQSETNFLGHVISENGVKTDPSKVEVIKNLKSPICLKELRSFLGLTSYYRKFIKDYSEIAQPLYVLTKKNVPWTWSAECETAFRTLKEKLTTAPILAYPKVDGGEFTLDCDASSMSIGAVLSQEQAGCERVIAYASRTLCKAEQNYCVTKLEMLAVVFFTKHFKHYLLGRHFRVRTDHGSLRWLSRFKEPDGQVQRWLEQLSQFDFDIIHRPGTKHRNADFLSRVVHGEHDLCRQCKMPFTDTLSDSDSIKGASGAESVGVQEEQGTPIVGALFDADTDSDSEDETEPNQFHAPRDSTPKVRRKRGRKANRPASAKQKSEPENELTVDKLLEYQEQDQDIRFVRNLKLENASKPEWAKISHESSAIKFWIARWDLLALHGGLLCIKWEYSEEDIRWRVCVPKGVVPSIMWYIHDAHVSGHMGIKKSYEKAKQCPFFWKGMRQSVVDYVRCCELCGESNNPPALKRHYLRSYVVGHRFERIAMDLAGPFPRSHNGHSYILVIGDYFTKLVEIFPLSDMTAVTVAECVVRGWIKRYGCPREIHSDQGRQFESAVFQEVCKLLEISKTRTTPLHARSDGFIERMNRSIQNILSKLVESNQKDWDTHLDFITMAYNSTPQESTGYSPYHLLYGEEITIPLDLLSPVISEEVGQKEQLVTEYASNLQNRLKDTYSFVQKNLNKASVRQKRQYDTRVKAYDFNEGDLVWRNQKQCLHGMKTKIKRHWTGPWKITNKICDVLFRIQNSRNLPSVIIHGDNLKKYFGEKTVDLQPARVLQQGVVLQPRLQEFVRNHVQNSHLSDTNISLSEQHDTSVFDGDDSLNEQNGVRTEDESVRSEIFEYESIPDMEPAHSEPNQGGGAHENRENLTGADGLQLGGARSRGAEKDDRQESRAKRGQAGEHGHSSTNTRTERPRRLPKHLQDFICYNIVILSRSTSVTRMPPPGRYWCDTCGRSYSNKRNLNRHMHEKHSGEQLHFSCPEPKCASRFIRRSFVTRHLVKYHMFDMRRAKQVVSDLVLEAESSTRHIPKATPSKSTVLVYEDISDEEKPTDFPSSNSTVTFSSTYPASQPDSSPRTAAVDRVEQAPVIEPLQVDELNEWMDTFWNDKDSGTSLGDTIKKQRSQAKRVDSNNNKVRCDSPKVSHAPSSPTLTDIVTEEVNTTAPTTSDADTVTPDTSEEDINTSVSGEKNSDESTVIDISDGDSDIETIASVVEEGEERCVTEYISVTLKTTTKYMNEQIVRVDRVAQLAYSDNFQPQNVDPMQLFEQVQSEFREYVNSFERESQQDA